MTEEQQLPDLSAWIHNQAYVPRNVIAVVTRNVTPHGEKGSVFAGTIKTVIELHPISIRGLWSGFSPDGAFMPYPEFRTNEKYGRPIDQMLTYWHGLRTAYATKPFRQSPPEYDDLALEHVTVDVMFIEPDPTCTVAVQAWHGINMYLDSYEGIESKRDLSRRYPMSPVKGFRLRHQPKPVINKFTLGYESMLVGDDVHKEAQAILNGFQLQTANPYLTLDKIDAIVTQFNKEGI